MSDFLHKLPTYATISDNKKKILIATTKQICLCRNLPRAIYVSMPLVTIIYVLANVAYLAVLSPTDMKTTKAIAVVSGQSLVLILKKFYRYYNIIDIFF